MKCPNCDSVLQITERHNVEIDYCPSCRGVWLDKGELDKVIEYASRNMPGGYKDDDDDDDDRRKSYRGQEPDYGKRRDDSYGYDKNKKKKNFLGDLFDFG
jgi:uncharacterized protein